MRQDQAIAKFRDYMRLRHLALSTEQSYLAWLSRSYATHSLNRGVNPRAIQQAMGHASLEVEA